MPDGPITWRQLRTIRRIERLGYWTADDVSWHLACRTTDIWQARWYGLLYGTICGLDIYGPLLICPPLWGLWRLACWLMGWNLETP